MECLGRVWYWTTTPAQHNTGGPGRSHGVVESPRVVDGRWSTGCGGRVAWRWSVEESVVSRMIVDGQWMSMVSHLYSTVFVLRLF